MYEELKYWYLRDHKLFRILSYSQIKQLCIISNFKKAKKGDILYFSDTNIPQIFLLKKGNIKIVEIDNEGNEKIKEIIQKGDLFGELTLEQNNSNEVAKALTDEVIICSFLLSDFENLMRKYPDLALSYTKFIGFKIKKWKNNYNNLIFLNAETRLLLFLIEWAEQDGIEENGNFRIENYLTQNDIAQIICTSRQTTISLLSDLEQKNIISYSRKEIMIPNIEVLKNLIRNVK